MSAPAARDPRAPARPATAFVGGVGATSSTARSPRDDGGAKPTTPLQISPRALQVRVIPAAVARTVVERYHYLHSGPAAVTATFGVLAGEALTGVVIFTAGPINAHRLVAGVPRAACWTLARLWLADDLPRNSESRVLAVILRSLHRYTAVQVVVSYADPAVDHAGVPHLGYVYQACGFLYTGRSEAQPLMAIGAAPFRHTRSIASAAGTHSRRYFERQGLAVRLQPTVGKHRYLYCVEAAGRARLRVPVLPYPKAETR